MTRCFFVAFFIVNSMLGTMAQQIMLEKETGKSVFSKKGKTNQKSFGYIFADYQFYPFKASSDIDIEPFKSRNFSVGYKRSLRLTNWNLLVGGLAFTNDSYSVTQNAGKIFPTAQLHSSEKVVTYNVTSEISHRVLLKKDYKHLGVYFDIGVYGGVTIGSRHKMFDSDIDKALNGKDQVIKVRGLKYVSPFNYGATFRFGVNRFALVTKIRLGNWLKPSYNFGQPPGVSTGLEFSLY